MRLAMMPAGTLDVRGGFAPRNGRIRGDDTYPSIFHAAGFVKKNESTG
jgi:hypothetical protein